MQQYSCTKIDHWNLVDPHKITINNYSDDPGFIATVSIANTALCHYMTFLCQHCWFSLLEEHEALREEHSRLTEELQWQNSKLKAQRNTIRNDLEKAKSTLKALEGADEHGTYTHTHNKYSI